jgi:N-acetylneuraminic acid mutarotase
MKGTSSKPLLGSAARSVCLMAVVLGLVACHGSGSANSSSYTVGGTITGLTVSSVVLANGTATVTVLAGATTWVFPGSFTANSAYAVTVVTQPVGELCEVTGAGSAATLTGNVSDVIVTCSNTGDWIWEGGVTTVNASGTYGTQGAASASSTPGGRYSASSWTDSSGTFWLFGGAGYDSSGAAGSMNDLWQFSPSTGLWTWVSGGSGDKASGIYGTQGTASATNVPGAREAASTWTDASGNLWLFGGYGYDSTGALGRLNDLWRYTPSTNQWTWISGDDVANAGPVYGLPGTPSATNVPGARYSASSWIDASGNLWLFGGFGYDATGAVGNMNDLWRYSPSTNQWTWLAGGNADNTAGHYGTQGTAAAANVPGARQAASAWSDSSGTLWLLGGYGYDSIGQLGYLNDLWQYSPSSGLWIWISGYSGTNAVGVYGTQGTPAAANVPGARQAANTWIDSAGEVWLFGGYGCDSAGDVGALNDLWHYSPSTKEWTSVSGATLDNAPGNYGTQGTASASSAAPGARQAASSWIDSAGNLWLFGGAGFGSTGNGYLNDLWQFEPPS